MISAEFKALSRRSSDLERLRARLLSRTALCSVLSIGILFGANARPAKADPRGTKVVHGKVSVQKSGTHTQFKQRSGTAILNHSSFDIRSNESVHFQQPGSNALAVNRVVGSDVSTSIAGRLSATGNVWVLNPSGVAISNTARINVNGLLATTAKISDRDILAGRASGNYTFSGAADGTAITNAGSIAAGDGHVVLVAPIVENSGTITTKGSDIALGAGSGFTVDIGLDGLTRFEVQEGSDVSLTNSGALGAEGGAIYLSAAEANAVESAVVSIGGEVEATRIENRGGKIVISGGNNGVTEVSGTINAAQATGNGGQIVITGDLVDIKGTALIDASGAASGGKVEIGGGFQGRTVDSQVVRIASASAPEGAPLPVAKRTAVREGAVIRANAGIAGDGGEVIVWADEATWFHGQLEARGGLEIGDGGFAEISGKIALDLRGEVDLTALNGSTGVLLLDPFDILIADGGTASGGDITFDGAVSGTTTLDASYVNDQAAMASLMLQAENDITINEAISTTNADVDVSFAAGRNIVVNEDVAVTGDLVMSAGDSGAASPDAAGTVDFSGGGAVSGASVTIDTAGGVTLGGITSTDVTIDAGGTIDQLASTSVVATTSLDVTATDTVTLDQADNDFGAVAISAASQDVTLVDVNAIDVTDVTAASLSVEATNGIAAVETARAGGNLGVPVLTLIDTDVELMGPPASRIFTLQGSGSTDNSTATLNVDQLVDAGVTDLTFEASGVSSSSAIALVGIDEDGLNLSLATQGGVGIGAGTTTLQNLTVTSSLSVGDFPGVLDSSLVVVDTASLTAVDNIVFNNATDDAGATSFQDFSTLTASAGGFIGIDNEANAISLGDLSSSESVSIDAGGAIDQLAGTSIVATTSVDLISGGAVTLGGVDAASLNVDATAGITDDGNTGTVAQDVSISGVTTLTAGSDIILDDDNHEFGTVTAAANAGSSAFELDESTGITFDNIAASTVSVDAGGTVDQVSSSSIVASGTVSITATDSVTLDDSDNDFGAAVSVTTTDDAIVLEATNAITLGAVSGSSLDVTADGSITDTDDQAISISGESTFDIDLAGSDILLDDDGDITNAELHTFGDEINFAGDPGDVEIQTLGTLTIAGLTVDDTSANTVIFGAANDIILNGSINAEQVTLQNNDGASIELGNDVGGTANISDASLDNAGDNIVISGSDAIDVDGVSLGSNRDIDITTTGGAVTFQNNASTFGGDLGVVATAAVTQDVAITVSDDTSISAAGQTVDLSNTSNDFTGAVDVAADELTLRNQSDITLGNMTVTGDLDVAVAAGDILDNGTDAISVAGTTSIAAADDIDLDNGTHTFGDAVANPLAADRQITLSADRIIEFAAASGLVVDDVSATNATDVDNLIGTTSADGIEFTGTVSIGTTSDLEIESGGDVVQSAGSITADTLELTATDTSVDFTLDQSNDVNTLIAGSTPAVSNSISFTNSDGITIGGLTTSALSVTAGGTINDTSSAISVTGATTLTAVDGAGTNFFDVLMDESDTHDFGGSVFVTGEDVVLDDTNALVLGAITTNYDSAIVPANADTSSDALSITDLAGNDGDLFVRSRGSITDTDGEVITVVDTASLTAQDSSDFFDIDLDETHAFSTTTGILNATGEQVRIASGTGAVAGTITADGGSDDPTLDVALSRSFLTDTEFLAIDAGDIDLSGFDVSASTLNLPSGGALAIRGVSNISSFSTLGASHVQLDSAGAGITLSGLSISADTFTVSTSSSTTGSVGALFTEGDDITFSGANSITGDFRAISGDDILQTGGTISVTGTTYLLAADSIVGNADQTISLNQADNDFQDTVDAIASGAITLVDVNDIDLGLVSAGFGETDTSGSGRDLTVTAGGTITQQDGADRQIFVRGDDDGTGTVDTDLDRAMSGGSLVDVLDSARVEAADSATFVAEEIVETVVGVPPFEFTLTSLSRSDVLLDNADNDFDRLSVSDPIAVDPVTARGEDIVLADRDALALGNVTAAEGDTIIADTSSDALSATYPLLSGNNGDLIISAGGLISQDSGTSIVAASAADIRSLGDITIDQGGNVLPTTLDLSGDAIVLEESGDVVLGSVNASSFSVNAGGFIIDDGVSGAGEDVIVSGTSTLTAGSIIFLDDDTHDFGTIIATANGGASTFFLDEASEVTFGDILASSVFVDAGGAIDQEIGSSIVSSGTASFTSTGDVTLDQLSNDFQSSVIVSGSAIELADANSLILSNVSGTTVSVNAGTTIDQLSGTSIVATDTADFSAGSDITLSQSGNDFQSIVHVDTSSDAITLADTNDIVLGGVDGLSLSVTAGGTITDDDVSTAAADDVVITGGTTLSSGGDIILDDDFHDLATVVATANGGSSAFVLDEVNSVTLSAISASTATVDAGTNVVLGGIAAGSLSIDAGGTISDDGISVSSATDVVVTGTTTLTSGGSITLDDNFHDFATVIANANGGSSAFLLDEINAVTLSAVSASSATVDAGTNVVLGGIATDSLSVVAGGTITDDDVSSSAADDIVVTGVTTLNSGGDIILDDDNHDLSTLVASANAGGSALEVDELTGLTLGNIAATTVSIDAGGTIDQVTGASIIAASTVDLTATDSVTLDQSDNDFQSVVDIDTSADAIVLVDTNGLILGGVDGSSLSVSAGGSITDDGVSGTGEDVSISGITTLNSGGDIILDDDNHDLSTLVASANAGGSALEVDELTGLTLGNIAATTVSIDAGGTIDQVTGSSIIAASTVDLTATDSVTLDQSDNDFQSVVDIDTSADAIVLVDTNGLILGGVDGSSLSVSAGGSITDDGVSGTGEDVSISGITTLNSGGDIILDDDNHDLSTLVASANAGGSALEVDELTGLTLGNIAATTVSIDAGGTIDQVTGASIIAASTVDLTATDSVTLDQSDNDFQSVVDIDTSADAIVLVDTNGLILGGVDGSSLSVSAGGSITDDGVSGTGEDVSISGITTLNSGGDIILDDDNHDLSTLVASANAGGSALEVDELTGLTLGNIAATTVSIDAGGTIDQVTGSSIIAASTVDLTATDSVTLDQSDNDFQSVVDIDTSADAIVLVDTNGLILGGVDGSSLSVSAGGSITDDGVSGTGEDVSISGITTLNSGGDIILDDDNHDLSTLVASANAGGSALEVDELTGLTLGNIAATTVSIDAGGTIDQVTGSSIIAASTVDLTATDSVTLDQSDNDFQSVVDIDTSADAIVLVDTNGLILGGVDGSSLSVSAGGSITDDGVSGTGEDVSISGITTLNSGGDIILDDDNHDLSTLVASANAGGSALEVDELTGLTLGNIAATMVSIDAGGTIDQITGTSIIATGTADFTSVVDITLSETANDFQSVVDASGINIALYDTNDIVLGGVDGANLDVNAGGSITDDGVSASAADDVVISGDTTLVSGDVIVLDDPNHDFNVVAGSANTGGSAFELQSSSGVTLDNVLASTVSVTAGGTIDQVTGASIVAGDTADFTSTDDITLDQATNDFQSTVDASGNAITLYDTDDIVLGGVDGTSLNVSVGATITDDGVSGVGEDVSISGITTLTSGGDIILDDDNHELNIVTASANAGTSRFELDEVSALTIGNLAASTVSIDAGGTIDQVAGSSIIASSTAEIIATDSVTLDQANNDFQSTLDVDTSDDPIILVDINDLILGGVDGSSLSVAAGGRILDDGVSGSGNDISISGITTLTSGGDIILDDNAHELNTVTATSNSGNSRFELDEASALTLADLSASTVSVDAGDTIDQVAGTSVVASGTADFTSTNDILLDQSNNDFESSLALSGDALEVVDRNDLTFANVTGSTVSVDAGGTIDQVSGSSIIASGAVDITATDDVTLNRSGNDFQATVDVNTSNDAISLRDRNGIVLGGIDGSSLLVRAGGGITDDGVSGSANDVSISGVTTLISGGDIVLDDNNHELDTVIVNADSGDADFELDESSAVTFGDVSASRISVDARGSIDQLSGSAIVAESAAEFTSTQNIRLNRSGNDFQSRVDAFGRAITLVDANDIRLGDVDASGDLTVRARSGNITDAGSSDGSSGGIDVAGVTSLSASNDITLDDLGNDFDSGDTGDGELARVDATGQDVTLTDEDAIILGSISASSLTVDAGGTITDTTDQAISVTGQTTLNSGGADFDIDLDNPNLHDFGGALSATGNDITIDDNGNLILGDIDSDGSLTIRANGAIDDTAGATITIANNGVFDSSNGVQLLIQSVGGTVDVSGSENIISVVDGNFRLGNTTLTGDSVFDALSGNLVLTTDHSVSGGSLFLIAEDGNVDLSGISLAGVSGPVLSASDTVAVLAPNGAIVMPDDIGANSFQVVAGGDSPLLSLSNSDLNDASVSTSLVNDVTSAVEFQFARDLLITVPTSGSLPANGVLDFDTSGTVQFTMNATSNFAIGQADFVEQVGSLAFDPLQFIGTLNDDQLLLSLDGDFRLIINNGVQTFNVQNTSSVIGSSNLGAGTVISGGVTIEVRRGDLLQFATFGEVADRESQNAAIGTVTLINFTPDENSTINGCVIGAITSCTPLGTVILNLQFETGQFLGIAFVDPDEDEDDPFSNRGDEEEWE